MQRGTTLIGLAIHLAVKSDEARIRRGGLYERELCDENCCRSPYCFDVHDCFFDVTFCYRATIKHSPHSQCCCHILTSMRNSWKRHHGMPVALAATEHNGEGLTSTNPPQTIDDEQLLSLLSEPLKKGSMVQRTSKPSPNIDRISGKPPVMVTINRLPDRRQSVVAALQPMDRRLAEIALWERSSNQLGKSESGRQRGLNQGPSSVRSFSTKSRSSTFGSILNRQRVETTPCSVLAWNVTRTNSPGC
jgi:hypothetical protein